MKKPLAALALTLLLCPAGAGAHDLPDGAVHDHAQPLPPAAPAVPGAAAPAQPQNLDWMSYKNPYAGEENDLANPHRTPEEIAVMAQQMAAEVLTFGLADYKEKLAGFKKYFVMQGWQLYAAYLRDSGVLSRVTADGYSVGAVVNSQPEIVSNGPMEGIHHWIVKLPVAISFHTTDAAGNAKAGPSGNHILYLDLARTTEGGNDSGIAISDWRVDPAQ